MKVNVVSRSGREVVKAGIEISDSVRFFYSFPPDLLFLCIILETFMLSAVLKLRFYPSKLATTLFVPSIIAFTSVFSFIGYGS